MIKRNRKRLPNQPAAQDDDISVLHEKQLSGLGRGGEDGLAVVLNRHCERSAAIQSHRRYWIAVRINSFLPSEVEGRATCAECLDFARHERRHGFYPP
jgi:hypothetical protein